MKIKFKRLSENAKLPTLGSKGAGGYDVYASRVEFKELGKVRVYLDLAVEVPEGYRLMMIPRSSITNSGYMLHNGIGLIDADYRGGIQARFITAPVTVNKEDYWDVDRGAYTDYNPEYPDFPYKDGDRIGQVYLEEIIPIEWEEVEELSDTERGEGGHGSTGK